MTIVFDRLATASDVTRVVIADDHPLVRGALCAAVASALPGAWFREAFDLASLGAALASDHAVDLVLLDLAMPGVSGFSGLLYLRSQHPEVPVIVVSATQDRAVMRRCIEVGAAGFIPKTTEIDEMREAIRRVLAGDIWTPPDLDLGQPADPAVADMMAAREPDTAAASRLDDVVARPAEQADCLRTQSLRGDRQGACLRNFAKTRGR